MALEPSYRLFQNQIVALSASAVVSTKRLERNRMNRRSLFKSAVAGLATLTVPQMTQPETPESEMVYRPIWRLENGTYVRVRMRDLKPNDIVKVVFDTTGAPVINKYVVISTPNQIDDLDGHENWAVGLKMV
jgi:hypothetical protein